MYLSQALEVYTGLFVDNLGFMAVTKTPAGAYPVEIPIYASFYLIANDFGLYKQ